MADGRKNNGGHKSAGRKSKAEEMGLPQLMKDAISKEDWIKMFEKCIEMAQTGSSKHFELLMQYQFGKATEHKVIDLDTKLNIIIE